MNTALHSDAKEVPSDVAAVKEQFLAAFDVVFLDPSSRLNLTARVSKYAMSEVRRCIREYNKNTINPCASDH